MWDLQSRQVLRAIQARGPVSALLVLKKPLHMTAGRGAESGQHFACHSVRVTSPNSFATRNDEGRFCREERAVAGSGTRAAQKVHGRLGALARASSHHGRNPALQVCFAANPTSTRRFPSLDVHGVEPSTGLCGVLPAAEVSKSPAAAEAVSFWTPSQNQEG